MQDFGILTEGLCIFFVKNPYFLRSNIFLKKNSFLPTLLNYFEILMLQEADTWSAVTQIHLKVNGNKLHCQLRILGLSQGDQRVFGFQI